MEYLNKNTGTLSGPLQFQSKGPWFYGYPERIDIWQFDGTQVNMDLTSKSNLAYSKNISLRINVENPSFDGDTLINYDGYMIPNVFWVISYITKVLSSGTVSVDLKNFATIDMIKEANSNIKRLSDEIFGYNVTIPKLDENYEGIKLDLTKTKNNVKLLTEDVEKVKKTLNLTWIIDGGRPDGTARSI